MFLTFQCMDFCIHWASCDRFVDFDAIVMEFKLGFSMALNQGFKLTKKIPQTCIVCCILFGEIGGLSGLLFFMTVFSLGLSIVHNFILGCQTSLILSSFHRPLLSLTLVFICWLGEAQGGCCESCIVVCMCAF